MSIAWLIGIGIVSGSGAGLLAGLIGIGGGIVVVPVVYFGLLTAVSHKTRQCMSPSPPR